MMAFITMPAPFTIAMDGCYKKKQISLLHINITPWVNATSVKNLPVLSGTKIDFYTLANKYISFNRNRDFFFSFVSLSASLRESGKKIKSIWNSGSEKMCRNLRVVSYHCSELKYTRKNMPHDESPYTVKRWDTLLYTRSFSKIQSDLVNQGFTNPDSSLSEHLSLESGIFIGYTRALLIRTIRNPDDLLRAPKCLD